MRQRVRAREGRENFPPARTTSEIVGVCRSMVNWQQLTNFRGHFARQELAASAAETRAPTFRAWKTLAGLIRRGAFSSPENYSCPGLGKHDVKRSWMINY